MFSFIKLSVLALGLKTILLTHTVFAATTEDFTHNVQSLRKSIEFSGEVPEEYMQKENLNYISDMAQALRGFILFRQPDLSLELTTKEAKIFLKIAEEAMAYHKKIDLMMADKNFRMPLVEGFKSLEAFHLDYKKAVISHVIDLLNLENLSAKTFNIILLQLWQSLASAPRVDVSSAYRLRMKEDLKSWLTMTELIIKKSIENPLWQPRTQDIYRQMLSVTYINDIIFQVELIKYINQFNFSFTSSLSFYATVKSILAQSNILVIDPMQVLKIEGQFPPQVRAAYDYLSSALMVTGANIFMTTETFSPNELVKGLKLLLNNNVTVEDEELFKNLKADIESEFGVTGTDVGNLYYLWSTSRLIKPYYQHIELMKNYLSKFLQSNNMGFAAGKYFLKDETTFSYSDLLNVSYIIIGFSESILNSYLHPTINNVMAKALTGFIISIKEMGGFEISDQIQLMSKFSQFRHKRPHDPHLTFLAKSLFQDENILSALRLIALEYLRNSYFYKPLEESPKTLLTSEELDAMVREELDSWFVQMQKHGDGYEVVDVTRIDNGESNHLYMGLLRAIDHGFEDGNICVQFLQ